MVRRSKKRDARPQILRKDTSRDVLTTPPFPTPGDLVGNTIPLDGDHVARSTSIRGNRRDPHSNNLKYVYNNTNIRTACASHARRPAGVRARSIYKVGEKTLPSLSRRSVYLFFFSFRRLRHRVYSVRPVYPWTYITFSLSLYLSLFLSRLSPVSVPVAFCSRVLFPLLRLMRCVCVSITFNVSSLRTR